jgi:hypothetical protein
MMLIMRLADLDLERVSAELTGWATAFGRGQVRHPLLAVMLPHHIRRESDPDWLKFEAVFAAHQDRLGAWTAALPDRLAAIAANAKEQA